MEEHRRLPQMGFHRDDLADRAEHARLLKRLLEEEKANRDKLLFGGEEFGHPLEREA